MRDLLLLAIIAPGCLVALRHPFVGAMLWAWLSLMSPHRLAFGFMFSAPVAQAVAVCTLVGLLASAERRSPWVGAPAKWLAVFVVWMCVTTALAINPVPSFGQLQKILKIDLMIFVTIALVRTRREIMVFAWVIALSLAFYGVKGGLFTLASGGANRVYGPSGTYIAENNALAVALIMTIPLMRFLQTTLQKKWQRVAMTIAMLLCAVSSLGSQSRGALLAISAMLAVLWWRGKNKLMTIALIAFAGVSVLSFMPETWWSRMQSIESYQQDTSAMGRIGAWTMAVNLAKDRLIGGGFAIWRADLFARYSPDSSLVVSAHSVYFHVIGEHGFFGLFLYLGMWMAVYVSGGWLRKHAAKQVETQWASSLGAMVQVSVVGFAVGGAFLSLAYYDLPYNFLALVVVTRWWVQSGAWKNEPPFQPAGRFFKVPLFFGDRWAVVASKARLVLPSGGPP
jgi:putative inorganic carbon (hco3(-)) transporter